MTRHATTCLLLLCTALGCQNNAENQQDASHGAPHSLPAESPEIHYSSERHLTNVRQLTFGGDNAEAYWAFNQPSLVYQATRPEAGIPCDRIFIMDLDKDGTPSADLAPIQVSNGLGRTTCPYYLPGDTVVVFASTHEADSACPAVPERGPEGRYVWPIYDAYDLYLSNLNTGEMTAIARSSFYDAEATVSPRGDRMVFTSTRDGDLDLYTCKLDGTDIHRVTSELGYDGGAFFSPDGQWLVWRASRPNTEEEITQYRDLLAQGMVEPTAMELFVARVDGSEMRQITNLGGANWAPFFHPSGEKILFSSNHATGRFPFNIFMIGVNGGGLEQVTFDGAFDSFPMFSPDGSMIAFSSNRNNGRTRNTNLFVADWVD
jgi:Tol biopolymer transport system component